jgi:hypothetical protein
MPGSISTHTHIVMSAPAAAASSSSSPLALLATAASSVAPLPVTLQNASTAEELEWATQPKSIKLPSKLPDHDQIAFWARATYGEAATTWFVHHAQRYRFSDGSIRVQVDANFSVQQTKEQIEYAVGNGWVVLRAYLTLQGKWNILWGKSWVLATSMVLPTDLTKATKAMRLTL